MNKQLIFMMAGGMLAFASCNNAASTGPSEAQIDSMVNAKVQIIEMQLMAKNDSIITAMATMKADSMMLAMKGTTANATTRTTRPVTHTTVPVRNTTPMPTGKNDQAQQAGQPTGKNDQAQQSQGQPTGKKR